MRPLVDPDHFHKTSPGGRRASRLDFYWLLGAVSAAGTVFTIRIAALPRYFYWDDTQNGTYGQWYHLGRMLLDGTWTILEPQAWQAGNYLAEGQWGLLNPLWMLFGLLAVAVPNAVVVATVAKGVLMVIMTTGVFALSRRFGASAPWAAAAAAAAPLAGFTLYLDAPSWTTGFACAALLPWAWWGLRRIIGGAGPLAFLVAAYLLLSAGYVAGAIALVALFVAELAMVRDRRIALRILLAGVVAGLLTIVFYLPGLLTASVTDRVAAGIANDLFLGLDLSDLASAGVSSALPSISGYWGDFSPAPLQYISWMLPFAALFAVRGSTGRGRGLGVVVVFGLLVLANIIGPSVLGPLRYPARFMPYLVLAVLVLFAVLATRTLDAASDRRRRLLVLIAIAAGWWFAWSQNPGPSGWASVAVLIQIAALAALALFERKPAAAGRHRTALLAGAALLVTVLTALPQLQAAQTSPTGNFRVPAERSELQAVLPEADDAVFVVGSTLDLNTTPEAWGEVLQANLWYASDRISPSSYTVLPYSALVERLCQSVRGDTCPRAFDGLFESVQGTDSLPLADVMGVNTVVVLKSAFDQAPTAPTGWSVEPHEYTWVYARSAPVPVAGGVASTAPGTTITDVSSTSTGVRFTVERVDPDDPEIVLSRLDYPGYSVDGAGFAEPREGFLLTVDASGAEGATVEVRFLPPGWQLELVAGIVAVLIAVGWSAVRLVRRFRGSATV